MADNTEAKFILNFEKATVELGKLGAAYKPPNPIAELAAMLANLAQILTLKQMLDQKEAVEENERNSREDLYKTLAPRCSSVITYYKSAGADVNDLANLQFFVREIRGARARPPRPAAAGEAAPRTISAAQTSFANQQDWFAQFVEKVRVLPGEVPDEEEFKIASLEDFRDALGAANSSVITAEADTSDLRRQLDELLYTGAGAAFNQIAAAKNYVLAVFKKQHPVYKALTALKFRIPRRLAK